MSTAAVPAVDPRLPGPPLADLPSQGRSARAAATPLRPALELALFAGLGALGIVAWARLVGEPPMGRLLLALALACATGALLLWLATVRRPVARYALATAVAIAGAAAGLVVVGLQSRYLAPAHWDELSDGISSGLSGVQAARLPYHGGDDWLRLTLLLGVPALLGLGCALAFWPAPCRRRLRIAALLPMVAIYAIAATLDDPAFELLWGLALMALVAAWLWLPALEGRLRPALAATAVAALVALPLAAALDSNELWDWKGWKLFAAEREVSFDWNHHYGPLEWPRDGTTLLQARADQPLYWKASVLDRFDGFTWQRASGDDVLSTNERVARHKLPGAALVPRHGEWVTQATLQLTALESRLAVGFGSPVAVEGLSDVGISADGTVSIAGEPLRSGEQYTVIAYDPQPTARELRRAPDTFPARRFADSTLVGLPVGPPTADGGPTSAAGPGSDQPAINTAFSPSRGLPMPLWGRHDRAVREAVLSSPYAATYRLAHGLAAGARTPYDAVRAIETYLRDGDFDYTPTVGQHTYPLASFLFEDRKGYCQQFAGSMALMLRMIGIPTRVVSGFSPGRYDQQTGLYEVRDFDAHSWVEVYFRGIGWVTFDPTPAAAPAASQRVGGGGAVSLRGRGAAVANGLGRIQSLEQNVGGGVVKGGSGSGGGPWRVLGALTLLAAAVAIAVAVAISLRRRRRLARGESADEQLVELRAALSRLGWSVSGDVTLLALERRFSTAGRAAVSRYAAALREHRFAPRPAPPPGPAERRALRRAISAGGLRRRLRGLVAIPPGGPVGGA